MTTAPPEKLKAGRLARCSNQFCHWRDLGAFRVPKTFSCDKEWKCAGVVIPIWKQRWFQVSVAVVIFLAAIVASFLIRATAIKINQPRIVAISASESAVVGESWESYVEAKGQAPLVYQWYQGFRGDTSAPVPEATSARYESRSIVENSSYWVRVTNRYGSADSDAVTVKVIPAVDYGRELFELYREARSVLEHTDSIQILNRQLDQALTLTAEERQQDNNLLQITTRKQTEAVAAMHAKLNYLNTLNRRAVMEKLEDARRTSYPGIEGERRLKTISFIAEHWNSLRDGHQVSQDDLIATAQKFLPL